LQRLSTAALFLDESIGPMRLLGAGLVIAGIVIGALSSRRS
jgi:drug/metabolite transporter (DMT)-like permease